jgi:hypothetical protein
MGSGGRARQPALCLIGMEACVGAHHLSRKLKMFGCDARLMSATMRGSLAYQRLRSRVMRLDVTRNFCDGVCVYVTRAERVVLDQKSKCKIEKMEIAKQAGLPKVRFTSSTDG